MASRVANPKGPLGQRKTTAPRRAPAKKATPKKVAPKKVVTKAIAKLPDLLPTDLDKTKARALTKRLKTHNGNTIKLLKEAAQGRVWVALGYRNWNHYLDVEFKGERIFLPRESRKESVLELAGAGLSSRMMADALQVDKSTINRDLAEALGGGSNEPVANGETPDIIDAEVEEIEDDGTQPDSEPEPVTPAAPPPEPVTRTVTGQDGKERTVTVGGTKPKEVVPEVVKLAKAIASDLYKIRERLGKLLDRDDYNDNIDTIKAVDEILRQPIGDLFDEVREFMPEPEPAGT